MYQDTFVRKYIPEKYTVQKSGNIFLYQVSLFELKDICKTLYYTHHLQLKIITATDNRKECNVFRIFYVFGIPVENIFLAPFIELKDDEEFPSLTKDIHEASHYERKIKTFFGLYPNGHPRPRSLLLHENWPEDVYPLRKDFHWQTRPSESHNNHYEFREVKGDGIYEIPVGPVHAGIIEPGHFRFSVAGEEIIALEPRLGYTHKGTEKLFETLSFENKIKLSERVSGDTSFTHSLAFCQAIESLADIQPLEKAQYLRVIFSELERLANHFNDIGFIMADTGYNFGGSNGSRLKEKIMQLNENLSGSRFLRGMNVVGGVNKDLNANQVKALLVDLKKIHQDFNEVIKISEDSSSLLNRLQGTGKLDYQMALDHGILGVAGRALGLNHDARIEYPYAMYHKLPFEISLEKDGDVYARLYVRIKEVQTSMNILEQTLEAMPSDTKIKFEGDVVMRANSCALGITEGWRGEIVYFVFTDNNGEICRVDVRDPSFLNWTVLGYAGKDNVVPDFPLINKSFNLSYSGNDL